jgi:drug/metabolite transporter (DMT)-like permease
MSGAIASAMGYVLWYLTLRRITTTAASVSQLAVPILAASGGIVFLNESLSLRLMIASALIVGGIVLTIVNRKVPESSGDRSRAESPSEVTT